MTVIAIVNRKGGSGKSTLATHVAAWLSRGGERVMLGDVDRQQSSVHWLRRREKHNLPGAPLVGWALDPRNVLRPPVGVSHVVLDTPGGLQGFDLNRLLMFADVVLMPVCHSIFDRESATDCLAELRSHPRVASGRVRVAAIGMRVESRTRGEQHLRAWAQANELEFLGALRNAQAYVRSAEAGLTVFDLPPAKTQFDRSQWQPVLDWLAATLEGLAGATPSRPARLAAEPLARSLPEPGRGASVASAASATSGAPAAPSQGPGLAMPRRSAGSSGSSLPRNPPTAETGTDRATSGPAAKGLRRLLGWLVPQPLPARVRHGS
ncbi:MAG: ParA family protein [Burkholderiales bacterium]|nr:ParA family protein [Burkholderiales bacterium]